ncbi:uncharacterized protein LOC129091486 isoform X2 [Anoplopoma fimbria]|uniref:uncharacterized protein LOC129091486 isoform X2 n=1 Tax=Anoplopoma fimbria TaxID=229290 RepID=UPI0023EE1B4C|nr:uncharacterized protein LOC129091486 isoform X2 [Anoplopoma fimbria]
MAPRVTDWPQRLLPMPSPLCTMILYLLFLVLILGNVSSQTANMTEEELIKVEGNQTFRESITNNTTIKPGNLTSNLYKDKTSLIEDELQNNNITLVEDNEHFQDKENQFQGKHCNEHLLVMSIHSICGDDFHKEMMSISTENWCVLENIIRLILKTSKL